MIRILTGVFGIGLFVFGILKYVGFYKGLTIDIGDYLVTILEVKTWFVLFVNLLGGFAWILLAVFSKKISKGIKVLSVYGILASFIQLIWILNFISASMEAGGSFTATLIGYLLFELFILLIPLIHNVKLLRK